MKNRVGYLGRAAVIGAANLFVITAFTSLYTTLSDKTPAAFLVLLGLGAIVGVFTARTRVWVQTGIDA